MLLLEQMEGAYIHGRSSVSRCTFISLSGYLNCGYLGYIFYEVDIWLETFGLQTFRPQFNNECSHVYKEVWKHKCLQTNLREARTWSWTSYQKRAPCGLPWWCGTCLARTASCLFWETASSGVEWWRWWPTIWHGVVGTCVRRAALETDTPCSHHH